jgi:nucleoside-diphosphate-sugar epimerase
VGPAPGGPQAGSPGAEPPAGAPEAPPGGDDAPPADLEALEERLSRPSSMVRAVLARTSGDLVIVGAGGKMGPSLARMARRTLDELGGAQAGRRVVAVSRWSDRLVQRQLEQWGVVTASADLLDRGALAALPDAGTVVYMAGLKFGTADAPARMWATNTLAPAHVIERWAGAKVVAFSTGNVYPNVPAPSRAAGEDHPLTPHGEYANACVARERVLEWAAERWATPLSIVRLSYAVDLRYGVLVDLAQKVLRGDPVDVRTGWVNVIWQGDANAQALASLARAAVPAFHLNVTGPEALSVADAARRLGKLLRREPRFVGLTAADALLSDTSLAQRLFGPPTVTTDRLLHWVAAWLQGGNPTLGRPTKFEVRDGKY